MIYVSNNTNVPVWETCATAEFERQVRQFIVEASNAGIAPQTQDAPGLHAIVSSGDKSAPARLHCPAHGRISHEIIHQTLVLDGKPFCPKCLAQALERIGVHQLVEKAPEIKKGW